MRFLFVGILVLLFSACLDEPDCIVTATNRMRISLKRIDVDSANTVLFAGIFISGTDTVLYENDSISSLSLPLNPRTTETKFTFYYGLKIDSLIVAYTQRTKIISPQCGAFNYFQELTVVSTSFVDVKVINPQLSTSGSTNLEIKL